MRLHSYRTENKIGYAHLALCTSTRAGDGRIQALFDSAATGTRKRPLTKLHAATERFLSVHCRNCTSHCALALRLACCTWNLQIPVERFGAPAVQFFPSRRFKAALGRREWKQKPHHACYLWHTRSFAFFDCVQTLSQPSKVYLLLKSDPLVPVNSCFCIVYIFFETEQLL